MKFDITSRWDGSVLFSLDTDSLKLAVESAVQAGVSLAEANLEDENLCRADLRGANLRGATLNDSNLCRADLRGADLRRADLRGANLRGANLYGANLRRADLRGANLRGANLRGADLRGANLIPIRDDIWHVLSSAPAEVPGLRVAIIEGRIDGSSYEGDCCCLVGTLAHVRGCAYTEIPNLRPDSYRPAECFFLAIQPGDTPTTSQFSKLALTWVDQWLANNRAAV